MSAYDGKTSARIVPCGHSEESMTIEFSVFGDNVARLRSMLGITNGGNRIRSATEIANGGNGDVSQAMDTILGVAEEGLHKAALIRPTEQNKVAISNFVAKAKAKKTTP